MSNKTVVWNHKWSSIVFSTGRFFWILPRAFSSSWYSKGKFFQFVNFNPPFITLDFSVKMMVQSQTTWYVLKEKSKNSIKTYSTIRRTEKFSVKIHALILYKKTIKIMVYYARHHEYYYHMIISHQQFQNFICSQSLTPTDFFSSNRSVITCFWKC